MHNKQQYKLFLNLSLPEIEMVSEDVELFFKGYSFFYAIDTYDLVHFFLPYLDKLEFTEEHLTTLAQEAIAYENFFSETYLSSIIFMEEYEDEITSVKKLFLHKIKAAFELAKNIDNLKEEIENIVNSDKLSSEVYRTNFDLFFLLVILSQRKKEVKEVTFLNFLKQKAHVNFIETENDEFNFVTNEAITMDLERGFTRNLYEKFIDHSTELLRTFSSEGISRYLRNTYTDIEVIQRILETNEVIFKDPRFEKTVFYYLSSTPYKSPLLFELVHKYHEDKYSFMGRFVDKQRSIHRNIFQVYLLRMLIEEYKDPEVPRKILGLIKIIKQTGDVLPNEEEGSVIEQELDKLLNKYSNSIENHFFLKLLNDKYKDTLKELIHPDTDGSKTLQNHVTNTFNRFMEFEKDDVESLDITYALAKFGQLNLLKEAILSYAENGSTVKVRFGMDVVKFNYHHLPYLLYLYDNKIHSAIPSFFNAVSIISQVDHDAPENYLSIDVFLEEILLLMKKRMINRKTLEFLCLIFIDLLSIDVLPNRFKIENFEISLIKILEKWLKRIKELDERRTRRKDYKNPLIIEIYYVLLWLYRRNLKLSKIFSLERELRKFKQDARLSHGFGLAYVSSFYQGGRKDEKLLHRAITNLLDAVDGYENRLWSIYNSNLKELLCKSIIGIYNSISDCYIRLYIIEQRDDYIASGRFYLNKMKQQISKINLSQVVLPIPAITESELEYYESRILARGNDKHNAILKIGYAIRKYEVANSKKSLMAPHFKEFGDEMIQYRDELTKNQ